MALTLRTVGSLSVEALVVGGVDRLGHVEAARIPYPRTEEGESPGAHGKGDSI